MGSCGSKAQVPAQPPQQQNTPPHPTTAAHTSAQQQQQQQEPSKIHQPQQDGALIHDEKEGNEEQKLGKKAATATDKGDEDSPTKLEMHSEEQTKISPRSSIRKSVRISESDGSSPDQHLAQNVKHFDELSRRSSFRRPSLTSSSHPEGGTAPANDESDFLPHVVKAGPRKLTPQEVEKFKQGLQDDSATATTSRSVIVEESVSQPRQYAVKSFSVPAGHPDHDPDSDISEERRRKTFKRFDPSNPHLAPPSALHRIATRLEKSKKLVRIERPVYCRATTLCDAEYQPPKSSISVQYPMGIINPSVANGQGDASKINSSCGNHLVVLTDKSLDSAEAAVAANSKSEHPLRAVLRAHGHAAKHHKKGKKLLGSVPVSIDFTSRSPPPTPSSSSSLTATWPPSPASPASLFQLASTSGTGGFAESKDERDRHRTETKSSSKKKNTMMVTVPLDVSRNMGIGFR